MNSLLFLDARTMLVAVRITGETADTISLYRTTDGGESWRSFQNGFGVGGASNGVNGLVKLPSGVLLATGTGAVVAKSIDGAESWRTVWGDWWLGAVHTFAHTDPNHPHMAWAGGETGFLQPLLLKSTDEGDSWREIGPDLGGDNSHYTVAIDPQNPDQVYTGVEGRVLRSIDGGDMWETVLSPPGYPYFFGLSPSLRHPLRIYAAGAVKTPEPHDLVVYISDDGGASWRGIVEGTARDGAVRDLLVLPRGDREEVYLATEEGVYRFLPDFPE